MGHNNINIEDLIRKQLLEEISAEEELLLEREKIKYSEDVYELMVVEVLRELGEQLPKGILRDWQPDVEAIIKKAKTLHGQGEKELTVKMPKDEKIFLAVAAAVAVIFFFGAVAINYFKVRDDGSYILPVGSSSLHFANDGDIPSEESSCMLLVGDSTWIKVYPDDVGMIKQVGDLLISRTREGLLKIERREGHGHEAPTIEYIEIYTEARQQCVLEIEDGTRIRLNAQTHLRYPLHKRDTSYVDLIGEAYVATSKNTLIVGTVKGKVTAIASDFVIRTTKDYTKLVLNNGALDLYSYSLRKSESLYCHGDLGVLKAERLHKSGLQIDTLFREVDMDFEMAKMWTRKVRTYKNISMMAFVEEMSRWEGFTIKRWDCLSQEKLVTVSVHYQSNREVVYTAIRHAGLILYEDRGRISFCPDDDENKNSMIGRSK